MTHYELADWVDYSRGLGDAGRRAAMTLHLAERCPSCRAMVDALETLRADMRQDERFEPPPHLLRWASALFARSRPERVRALPRLLARVINDSLLEPLPVGVRSDTRGSRRVLYEAGDLYVDLRLEQRPGDSMVILVGQLLGAGPSHGRLEQPVVLTSGRDVLSATLSNEHGEFHLQYVPSARVRLHIPVENGTRRIEIPLNRLMLSSDRSGASER